jgi:hypothetical protein
LEYTATLIPMYPERMEVKAPNKKAIVVQKVPNSGSTVKKIKIDKATLKIAMYLYSANKKALAPLSMKDPISNNNSALYY